MYAIEATIRAFSFARADSADIEEQRKLAHELALTLAAQTPIDGESSSRPPIIHHSSPDLAVTVERTTVWKVKSLLPKEALLKFFREAGASELCASILAVRLGIDLSDAYLQVGHVPAVLMQDSLSRHASVLVSSSKKGSQDAAALELYDVYRSHCPREPVIWAETDIERARRELLDSNAVGAKVHQLERRISGNRWFFAMS